MRTYYFEGDDFAEQIISQNLIERYGVSTTITIEASDVVMVTSQQVADDPDYFIRNLMLVEYSNSIIVVFETGEKSRIESERQLKLYSLALFNRPIHFIHPTCLKKPSSDLKQTRILNHIIGI